MAGLATAWLISWALMLAYAVPVALVIYRRSVRARAQLMLAAALAWGGVIATSSRHTRTKSGSRRGQAHLAGLRRSVGSSYRGPRRRGDAQADGCRRSLPDRLERGDGVLDGFVYGAMVGLGFTVVEDVSYFINAVAAVPGSVDQSGPVLTRS